MRFWLTCKFIVILWLTFWLSAVHADQGALLYQTCSACHGPHGEGNPAVKAPVLAGQFDWYLSRQLEHFAKGIRATSDKDVEGKLMVPFAQQLQDPQQNELLVRYISQLPKISVSGSTQGDLKNGSRYYQAKCGACHGGNAQGNPAFNAPKLSGQHPDYLLRQMRHFQQGLRGAHQQDKLGKQMAMMAGAVSDKELQDIVFFITEQP